MNSVLLSIHKVLYVDYTLLTCVFYHSHGTSLNVRSNFWETEMAEDMGNRNWKILAMETGSMVELDIRGLMLKNSLKILGSFHKIPIKEC